MLACILNTKAENGSVIGSISPIDEFLGSGEVVSFKKSFKNGSTPKFVRADPKNTGVNSPFLTFSKSNSSPAISNSSTSSINLLCRSSPRSSLNLGSSKSPVIVETSLCPWFPPSNKCIVFVALS